MIDSDELEQKLNVWEDIDGTGHAVYLHPCSGQNKPDHTVHPKWGPRKSENSEPGPPSVKKCASSVSGTADNVNSELNFFDGLHACCCHAD